MFEYHSIWIWWKLGHFGHHYSGYSFFSVSLQKKLPGVGFVLSLVNAAILLRKMVDGVRAPFYDWLFSGSNMSVWIAIILLAGFVCETNVLLTWVLCFWWIIKVTLGILYLHATFGTFEQAYNHPEKSGWVFLDIVFGISITFMTIKRGTSRESSLEDALLTVHNDAEEDCLRDTADQRSFCSSMTFGSISAVMNRGVLKQLEFEDLLSTPGDMEPSMCHRLLSTCWRAQFQSSKSFFGAICCAYGWQYLRLGLLKIFNDCLGFLSPLLLNKLIKFLEGDSMNWDGYILAILLGFTSTLKSFCDTQYTYRLTKLKLKIRSGIMTLIYEKCLFVSMSEISAFSEGEIQTFMSIDADRTVNLCNSFHDAWSLPFQIGVALYLLYVQVNFAFLSGLTITILLIPVNKWISEKIAEATQKMMKQKDERIRRTGEILTHIRTLKMYGWENLFAGWVMDTRSVEVKHLATRKYLDAWCVFFWATTPTLFSLFTFGLFTLMGHKLDAATVFTCLALFNNLISPLNSFPWVINGLIDAFISTRRLSRLLSCPEKRKFGEKSEFQDVPRHYESNFAYSNAAILMKDASFSWSSNNDHQQVAVLQHVTLSIPKGSFVAVVGEVGSGKSSLLGAVLGEMNIIHGSIYSEEAVAYVPQVPWLVSGTLRDNILLGKSYDSARYEKILQTCALDVDVSEMSGGDLTFIGDKGFNLSGGQRARIALARAIYQGLDVVLLDDVLSAVDSQVARWILHNALLGSLMSQKTRLLCTHNVQAISAADMVIVMNKGHVQLCGSSEDLSFPSLSALCPGNEVDACCVSGGDIILESEDGMNSNHCKRNNTVPEVQKIVEVEERKEGRVEISVYKSYASFSGWFISAAVCISALLMQASRNGNDLWLSYWVDRTADGKTDRPTSFYLMVLCIFCLVNSLLTLLRAFLFAYGGLCGAIRAHHTLLNKLIGAPVQFFDRTPRGRMLNRLSSDLYTIDDSLPFILNILLANFVGLLGVACLLSYVQAVFLLLLIPFWFIYSKLQFFYRSTARELRRLDSVSRSPIYATFTETLDGSSTIRAFGSEDYFMAKFFEHMTMYQRTSYSEATANVWLSLRLQLLAAFVISFVAVVAVVGSRGHLPVSFGSPGLVGLALSYAAPIVNLLGNFLSSFTETEKEMVSIERVMQYMDIPQEDLRESNPIDKDWPLRGIIVFQNVTLRYAPTVPPALNDVSFTVEGGTKVGVIGRTGAGKSSILNSLFCIAPVSSGCILVDGLDIGTVPVKHLRSRIAVVPQSPFLFQGSLRDNLDPFQKHTDEAIWNCLDKCHVKQAVEAIGGLCALVKESGSSSFSVGQRQLLCLARALLRSSKILCLDECTANVDNQTAAILQDTIADQCEGVTMITVAHRISSVLNMDRIMVLEHGKLVEQGHPQALLRDHQSRFSCFSRASTM